MTIDQDPAAPAPRRSIAVISHPDAGKSTLTEALALHAHAISLAGAVHGKAGRAGVVSDWQEIEQKRGISISSAALQLQFAGTVINVVDTPGHADFSEDTYRVLTAVDCAVMLLDAAKGLEPQTLKLFDVCRRRGVPVLTFVNKWDRPGKDALELCDELEQRIGLVAAPLTWPIGAAGNLRGLLDPRTGAVTVYVRAPGGAALADEHHLAAPQAAALLGAETGEALEQAALLPAPDCESFLAGRTTPVLFGVATANIGVRQLLEAIVRLAPAPGPRAAVDGTVRSVDDPFSAAVFKVQAGMDRQHRDQVAFVRIMSGTFERGMSVVHAQTGRSFATKYAATVFGRDREVVQTAYPGDVVGLVNATALAVGDTLYDPDGPPVRFAPMPAFAPEHFVAARAADPGRAKQFRKGIAQLAHEGVVQLLISPDRGNGEPILGAVGPLQFEVVTFRMEHELGAPLRTEPLPYALARRATDQDAAELAGVHGVELVSRADGVRLALLRDHWHLQSLRRQRPQLQLPEVLATTA